MGFFRQKGKKSLAEIFHRIYYKSGLWKQAETGSGPGSTLAHTQHIRQAIPGLIRAMDIKSILDAPCGDLNWISHTDLAGIDYTGADIIPRLIEENRKKYPTKKFIIADITSDILPAADLVLCRDCFIHLPNKLILSAIANFKTAGIRYMLTNTYQFISENKDIEPGQFRMLNLRLPPFSLPECLLTIEEDFTDGYPDKKLCLWKL